MSNLRVGLSVLAVLIGAGSVFASNAALGGGTDQTYTWDHFDQSGTLIETVPNLTEQEAKQMFGCQGTQAKCAVAEGSNPVITIRYQ